MRRHRLLAAIVILLLVSLLFNVVQSGLLPVELYAVLGIDPPNRVTLAQRITQPNCPSSGDIEWLVVNNVAKHFDLSPNDTRVRRYVNQGSMSAIWRSVSLLCGNYRELGNPIAADFAERYASIKGEGSKFRRDIYCTVKPELTDRELYSWSKSFDYNDWQMITGGQLCGQA